MTDYLVDHKKHPNKFKRIDIIQSMFSNYNGIKVEKNNTKIAGEFQKIYVDTLSSRKWSIWGVLNHLLPKSTAHEMGKSNF